MSTEEKRIDALHNCGILDTPSDPSFETIVRTAQLAFDVPIVLISLVESTRQWFKAKIGLDVSETGIDVSFCRHTLVSASPLIINDAREDSRFKDNALVTGEPFIRFYAGSPIIDPEGYVLGTVCVIHTEPREISEREIALLNGFAECAMTAITSHAQAKLLQRASHIITRYTEAGKQAS